MSPRDQWSAQLRQVPRSAWPDFLTAHSGLPGPRANTELAIAYAGLADRSEIERAVGSADEYLAMCGTVGLGAAATDAGALAALHRLASDPRWRIREAVAMGLQLLGDHDFGALERIVRVWVRDRDPLVVRAAAAAICEPRLLGTPHAAAVAIAICAEATATITGWPPDSRRDSALRSLRQTLGYCWSVAVAAAPEDGMPVFRSLDDTDADVAWVIAQNLTKKRLARLL
ncbi:MAG: HEAT repeat domain-containing protein [Mycolicibacterium sp.]|nr:HEAT repeat domain-containing protein [Mycolicibacterium sp.]